MSETLTQIELFPPATNLDRDFDPKKRESNQRFARIKRPNTPQNPVTPTLESPQLVGEFVFDKGTHIWHRDGNGSTTSQISANRTGERMGDLTAFIACNETWFWRPEYERKIEIGDRFSAFVSSAKPNILRPR